MTTPNLKPRWRFHLFLACLVLLGCALRFHHIEKKSFWSDELFTLSMAMYHPLVPETGQPWYRPTSIFEFRDGDTFWTAKAAEQHPPLQDLLEKGSVHLLGLSEFSARLPGALAGCALLVWFAVFAARRQDPQERRIIAWALLLLTLSPALVVYAQDARAYSLGTSLAGMGALLWLLRWRHGWREVTPPSWGEVALLLLACYSHYNAAALVALLMGADLVVACKKRSWTTLARLAALTAVFAMWVALSAHTILATSQGAVAWGKFSKLTYAVSTVEGALAVLHLPWLLAWLFLGGALLAWHRRKAPPGEAWPRWGVQQLALSNLVLLYLVLAGSIVAKAGMTHARFYIFVFPIFAVACGVLLATLRQRWAMAAAGAFVAACAWPTFYSDRLGTFEDFRSASHVALRDFKQDSKFLYPWQPNRDLYRIYLEPWFNEDIRPRMVGVAPPSPEEVCKQLAGTPHVAVLGHSGGKPLVQAVYDACGSQWPYREQHEHYSTFAEHWRTAPPAAAPNKP
jgi:uncharacterized membrane protein